MARKFSAKAWLLPLLAAAPAALAAGVDLGPLNQNIDTVGANKIYYPWGNNAIGGGVVVSYTVTSTAPASQPTLVYNCQNMAAICKNVQNWLTTKGATLPYEFVYDLTGSADLMNIDAALTAAGAGGIEKVMGKKWNKAKPKVAQLSHIRRDQTCGTSSSPGPDWKNRQCPQPGQPSIIQSRFHADWDVIDTWINTNGKKPERTKFIKGRNIPVPGKPGQTIYQSSGLMYTCDDFPPASWVQGGNGMAGTNKASLQCAPQGNSVAKCSKVFDKHGDTKGLSFLNPNKANDYWWQMSEQDWQAKVHGKLNRALENLYGGTYSYAYFQFTTVAAGNNHGTSSRAWVVIPPSQTDAFIQKRAANGTTVMETPAPRYDVVFDDEIASERLEKRLKASARNLQRRASEAISPTPSFLTKASSTLASQPTNEIEMTPSASLPSASSTVEDEKSTESSIATSRPRASDINDTPLWQARRIIEIAQKEAGERNSRLASHPRMNRFPHMDDHNDILGRRDVILDPIANIGVNQTIAELAAIVAEADSGVLDIEDDKVEDDIASLLADTGISKRQIREKDKEDASGLPTGGINKRAGEYWMAAMDNRKASMPFNDNKSFKVWRNVKDYGAKGDGKTDDTAAINKAISDGNRCGEKCGSSTVTGAVIYFPPGTYLVSSPIIQYYYTQFIGDPNNRPTIKASKSFVGLGMLSSNVYIENASGESWYINQNNFFRQIRNFILDIRDMSGELETPAALHWQVAQATSLENISFIMPPAKDSKHMGIFMENGSGGFLSNLQFRGGRYGMFCGNQQFTTRDLQFVGQHTAIRMIWDWGWTWKDVTITSAEVGISLIPLSPDNPAKKAKRADPPPPPGTPNLGSLMVMDSTFNNVKTGVLLNPPKSGFTGRPTMNLYNLNFNNVANGVAVSGGKTLLAGGSKVIESFGMGWRVDDKNGQGTYVQGADLGLRPNVHASLLKGSDFRSGFYSRNKPQYQDLDISAFMNIKDRGAKGDGSSDDTAAINNAIAAAVAANKVLFFPAGSYIVTDTIKIPPGSRIVGQAWSQIICTGKNFQDMKKPRVMIRVGQHGDSGVVEISDMMFETKGPTPGAVLMEWNIREKNKGSAAMWDSHFRIGGAKGTELQAKDCPKLTGQVNPKCIAASLIFHMTKWSSAYLENVWVWTADHDLDVIEQTQIDIYTGRGVLIESRGPTWLYGTASEHHVLYQYQLLGAENIFLAGIQTESPYYQAVPKAPAPFEANLGRFRGDPFFSRCKAKNADPAKCAVSWGLRIVRSTRCYLFGGGLYSWFSNYEATQACVKAENCQEKMIHVMRASELWMYNIFTKGVLEMVSPWSGPSVIASKFKNTYVSSLMSFIRGRGLSTGGNNGGNGTIGGGKYDNGVEYIANPTPGMTIKYPPWFWNVRHPPASCIFPCTAVLPPISIKTTIQPPPVTVTLGPKISTITPPPVTDMEFKFETITIRGDDPEGVRIVPRLVSTTAPVPATTVTDDGSTYVIGFPVLRFPLPTAGPVDAPPCVLLCEFPPKDFPPVTFSNSAPPKEDSPPPGPPPGNDNKTDTENGEDIDPKIKGSDSDDGSQYPKPKPVPNDVDPKDKDKPPKNNPKPVEDGGPPPPPGPPPSFPVGGGGGGGPPPPPPGPEPDPEEEDEDEEEEDEEACERDGGNLPDTQDSQPNREGGPDGQGDRATVNGNEQPAYPNDPQPPAPPTPPAPILDWNSGLVQCYNSGWSITHAAALHVVDHFCGQRFEGQTLNKDNKVMRESYIHPSFLTGTRVIMSMELLEDASSWTVDGPKADQICGAVFRRIINGCDRNTADFKQGGSVSLNVARFTIDPEWDAGSSFDLPSLLLPGFFP